LLAALKVPLEKHLEQDTAGVILQQNLESRDRIVLVTRCPGLPPKVPGEGPPASVAAANQTGSNLREFGVPQFPEDRPVRSMTGPRVLVARNGLGFGRFNLNIAERVSQRSVGLARPRNGTARVTHYLAGYRTDTLQVISHDTTPPGIVLTGQVSGNSGREANPVPHPAGIGDDILKAGRNLVEGTLGHGKLLHFKPSASRFASVARITEENPAYIRQFDPFRMLCGCFSFSSELLHCIFARLRSIRECAGRDSMVAVGDIVHRGHLQEALMAAQGGDPNYPEPKGKGETEGGVHLPPDPTPKEPKVQHEDEPGVYENKHPKGPF
jgi:hypothetical protein